MSDDENKSIDEILKEFTDLMNEKGADSKEVKEYMEKYSEEENLLRLLEVAVSVKKAFDRGELGYKDE